MNPARRLLPVLMWAAVAVALAFVLRQQYQKRLNAQAAPAKTGIAVPAELEPVNSSGAVLVDVPWKHLPDVPDYKLVNQAGEEFDSRKLRGGVHAIYFFFSTCPGICRDLNRQIERLNGLLKDVPVTFVGVSVDPEVDQPEVLARYAEDFGAVPPRWEMLTGSLHSIKELGEHGLRLTIAKEIHTDNIVLVDKWGRYRDRFRWDDPDETRRFVETARALVEEKAVPLESMVRTRNSLAESRPADWDVVPWLREFELTDQNGKKWYSRDRTGRVWVASLFYSRCPDVCVKQNQYLAGLLARADAGDFELVSMTTDPEHDTPEVLSEVAGKLGADPARWTFLTGGAKLVRRVATEFFRTDFSGAHHTSRLYVVDQWHRVRGDFDWSDPADEARMLELIRKLNLEVAPGESEISAVNVNE